MKLKTGLFDMDGTLIDSLKAILNSLKKAASITGLKNSKRWRDKRNNLERSHFQLP